MNNVMTQRRKTVILASSIACFQMPALLMTEHLHGSRFLPVVVVGWAFFMAAMFAYVMVNLVKLKRMQRDARLRQATR